MLKLILSSVTALLMSMTAQAATLTIPTTDLHLSGGTVHAQADQYYRYDFGTTSRNFPVYREFYLRNDGPGDLFVHQIAISGGDYYASYNCPRVLPARTYCTISVRFQPWNEGFSTGRLYIDTSSGLITMNFTGWGRNY
ncbi:MAG: hypothetical protein H7326_03785 [Bdellovibrionaceae bacterium]|nr:hypothetical protein [Pseudobdellovibrionaceae bacterium]